MKNQAKRPPVLRKNGRSFHLNKIIRPAVTAMTAATVAIILSIFIFDLADDALALTRHDSTKQSLTVSNLSDLPNTLENSGIIKHSELFRIYLSISGKELARTTASVSPSMDYRALLSAFTDPPEIKTVRLTFPKGASVSDIIEIFLENGIGSREGFAAAINDYPFDYDFVYAIPENSHSYYRLEGYLYPDTYDFYTGRSEVYYISRMLDRFQRIANELAPICQKNGFTLHTALNIASLIESSAGFASSYERMSAVIYNRLQNDAPLEVPASSAYGINAKGGLFVGIPSDTLINLDSLYNTFVNKGLPPSPICNPSREALLCAVSPENSGYYYFVTQENGRVLFAKTASEHKKNMSLID